MKKIVKTACIVLSLTVAPLASISPVMAQVPVVDAGNLTQTIAQLEQMVKDYKTQLDQLTSLKTQIENQVKQLTAMTGSKGISDILNNAGIQNTRLGAPDLSSIMKNGISGSSIGGESSVISSAINDLKSKLDWNDIGRFDSSDKPIDRGAAELAGAGLAAVGSAAQSYKQAQDAGKRVNDLVAGIDAQPDLKASIDYNTRVTAEVAALLVEVIRIQAANANVNGMARAREAQGFMSGRKFNQIGEQNITGN